jgi:phosphoglycerate kinase
MNAVLSIDDIPQTELVGRRVLVRIEAEDDVPRPDPLSTVAFLSKSGARVVIATDKQLEDQRSLLTHLSGREVCKLREWKGETGQRAVAHLPEGGIALIENLALDPGEQTADDSFAKQLAQLCDIS